MLGGVHMANTWQGDFPRHGHGGGGYEHTSPATAFPSNIKIPRKVLNGGSHLCVPNYCRHYRSAGRHAEPIDTRPVTSAFAAW